MSSKPGPRVLLTVGINASPILFINGLLEWWWTTWFSRLGLGVSIYSWLLSASNPSSWYISICCHLTIVNLLSISAGWDVKVVLPSSQKSWIGTLSPYPKIQVCNCSPWIGKAFHVKEITKGNYFYPKDDGNGELTSNSRPLKNGELVSLQVFEY